MSTKVVISLGAAALLASAAAAYAFQPQSPASQAGASQGANQDHPGGAVLYERYCAGCHNPGPGHPATMLLEQLGREHPPLMGRDDLDPDYVRAVVRNGLIEMPPFRPTELTDAELDQVIAHIKSVKPDPKSKGKSKAKAKKAG
jgi:mono/diheme cytochrome c family protein